MKLEQQAHKWFAKGVEKSAKFRRDFIELRRTMMDAAFCFIEARECIGHGNWLDFLELHKAEIAPRTVQFWIAMAEQAIEWVKEAQPTLKSLTELHKAAREIVIQSPKPLVALLRDLREMRKFGEYDAVKYAAQKRLLNNGQIEFDFAAVLEPLDALCHFGDSKYSFVYPEGKDETEFIGELETKLDAALTRVRQIKQHGRVIET